MPQADISLPQAKIEAIIAYLKSQVSDVAVREILAGFAVQYFSHVAQEDLDGHSIETLGAMVLSLWQFAEIRKPGEVKIRLASIPGTGGGTSDPPVLEIINDDMPFLVDSVTVALSQQSVPVRSILHPVFTTYRDDKGRRREGGRPVVESFIHIGLGASLDAEAEAALLSNLQAVLSDVRSAVEDWQTMTAHLEATIESIKANPPPLDRAEISEAIALLHWMGDNNFTFLGARDYDYSDAKGMQTMRMVEKSGLGILRDPARHVMIGLDGFNPDRPETKAFLQRRELLIITKANARARVHRAGALDYVGVRLFDNAGTVIGERRFVGLFTSTAYNRNPKDIPLLRRKIARVMERAKLAPQSHDGKALLNILETYPRDELFQINEDQLFDVGQSILKIQLRPRLRLFARRDEFGRFFSCLVFMPRERYDSKLRRRFEAILCEAFGGRLESALVQLSDELLARIHFVIKVSAGGPSQYDYDQIERRLVQAMRAWGDEFQELLDAELSVKAPLYLRRYGSAFPTAYQESYSPAAALADIRRIETLDEKNEIAAALYRPAEGADNQFRLKLYRRARAMPLSECLPMLENMGFKVEADNPFEVTLGDGQGNVYIHDFILTASGATAPSIESLRAVFEPAFIEVWRGNLENDGLNRLIALAGLDWRDISLLRAYTRYLRQVGIAFSSSYMDDALNNNSAIAHQLVALFHARFDPARAEGRDAAQERIVRESIQALDKVASLDEDRILRRILNAIQATLRTNFYRRNAGESYPAQLSFKFDCAKLDELPQPRPYREIFVYSPRVEGIHLRGGKVARGGIRWSDRREDFRAEVLGLMKAQMVKNAVIVPVGAKGGFVPKRPPADGSREALQADGIECYRSFIRGLLDITDNRVSGKIVPPKDVVRHDEDDPYLVVAADKGTATFSDIANRLSLDYGFWLSDAFASGGSAGYDHKKMAITARGAWETVKRHFREIGKDIQTNPFSVVGIGDMSGDVFGNGMLLSPCIKLVAAFDHRHIFIDPTPDPKTSFAERRRLFDLPRSSWMDYDQQLISKGGGIFDRKAKSIDLSTEIQTLVGISEARMTPVQLIRAILQADVDLLWNGGIGTYVKASDETNAEIGDRGNEPLRVNGAELRAKVVGEGGNLGFSQKGRIEYARKGGHINTDALDNSAGVDCSDHEVNIKILLTEIVQKGAFNIADRDKLLVDMTDDVAQLVLQDNYLQSQAISVMEAEGVALLPAAGRFMRNLERQGRLDRAIEFLPTDHQLEELQKSGKGLTRPELAVLLAYAKMTLYTDLLESDLPEDDYFLTELPKYFPRLLRRRFSSEIATHQLRREIVTTAIANSVINRVGIGFIVDIAEETEANPEEITRAYAVGREIYELRPLWNEIEKLDVQVPAAAQTAMLGAIERLIQRSTLWFLRQAREPINIAQTVTAYADGVAALSGAIDQLLTGTLKERRDKQMAALTGQGVPGPLARTVANLEPMGAAVDIVLAAKQSAVPADYVARCYFILGEQLGLDWLCFSALSRQTSDHWQRMAVVALVDDLHDMQRQLARQIAMIAPKRDADAAYSLWEEHNGIGLSRIALLITELKAAGLVDAARLAIVNRLVRALAVPA